MHTKPLVTVF